MKSITEFLLLNINHNPLASRISMTDFLPLNINHNPWVNEISTLLKLDYRYWSCLTCEENCQNFFEEDLGEDVCNLLFGKHICHADNTFFYIFFNEILIHFHMFGPIMLYKNEWYTDVDFVVTVEFYSLASTCNSSKSFFNHSPLQIPYATILNSTSTLLMAITFWFLLLHVIKFSKTNVQYLVVNLLFFIESA